METNQSQTNEVGLSIKTKFAFGIALLVALIISLTSVKSSMREEKLLTEGMNRAGLLLASTLALACQEIFIKEAWDELIPYTERVISRGEDVKEISIIDRDGKYVGYGTREGGANLFGKAVGAARRDALNSIEGPVKDSCPSGSWIEYIAPVMVGSTRFGSVILKYSLVRLHEAKAATRRDIILLGVVALLAGVVLSLILAQFITKGIVAIIKGTRTVATGDLSYRLEVSSDDEIGLLARRFNDMVNNLETNNKALDRKIFEIETLFKASQAMNFQSDTTKLVRQILEMANRALSSERSSIMLLADDQADELVTKIVFGLDEFDGEDSPPPATIRIKCGEGVAGTVFKTGNSIIVNDGYNDPLFKSYKESADFERHIRNMISVPLKIKDRITGVINVVNKIDPSGFNPDDQRLLEALAQQAAMAVEHARLYELAITDGLTRLFIHRYFQARLEEEIMRAKRYHTTISLILFDIDHFKKFNDTYGHQQGDIVLVDVAKLIKQTVRDTVDIPARYGGEEFTIILPETDAKGAQLVAERLRKTIETFPFPGQDKQLNVTISVGIATFPDHASSRGVLIKKADIALYACKEAGRNCTLIFNDRMSSV